MSEELPYDKQILIRIAQIAMGALPVTFSEYGQQIWDAFRAGRDYEKLMHIGPPQNESPEALRDAVQDFIDYFNNDNVTFPLRIALEANVLYAGRSNHG
jgi:hypothetical protein